MKRIVLVIFVALFSFSTWAQGPEIRQEQGKDVVLERPGDPPAPVSVVKSLTEDTVAAHIIRNGHLSVQVNQRRFFTLATLQAGAPR